jgi:hypothetical protein
MVAARGANAYDDTANHMGERESPRRRVRMQDHRRGRFGAEDASLTATTWRVIAATIVIAGEGVAPGLPAEQGVHRRVS